MSLSNIDFIFGNTILISLLIQIFEYRFCGFKYFLSNEKKKILVFLFYCNDVMQFFLKEFLG